MPVINLMRMYAVVFNTRSAPVMGQFVEEIAPGAFDGVLNDDVRVLLNRAPSSCSVARAAGRRP